MFLDLCLVSDSEVAAVVVEHTVVIRDPCFDDIQPMCTWRAVRPFAEDLQRLWWSCGHLGVLTRSLALRLATVENEPPRCGIW